MIPTDPPGVAEKRPVCVGGPLHGKSFTVTDSLAFQCIDVEAQARETSEMLSSWRPMNPLGADPFVHLVTYRLSRFQITGKDSGVVIWLATVNGREEPAELVADAILNDAAKAARIGTVGGGA